MGGVDVTDEVDLHNRDPNNMNDHIKVAFEDVLGEPDHTHSMDCVWKNAYRCFVCSKNICYKLMTLCCGLCIAFYWGCEFAVVAFNHIWCYTPCLRAFAIAMGCMQKFFMTLVSCCCAPCCETTGLVFSKIRVEKA